MPVKLSPRLQTALLYIRGSGVVADIGTDHAYLPISLCEQGILTPATEGAICAVAADINAGPVERAAIHIATAGLSDRIVTVKTDGLCGLEQYEPSDVIIFGMGGELIASILAASPWVARAGRRLVLQPMTHAADLRRYLLETGWQITGETLSREGERIYQTICADRSADGTTPAAVALTPAELWVGEACYRMQSEEQRALFLDLIDKTVSVETAARNACRGAGRDTTEADALLDSLAALRATVS